MEKRLRIEAVRSDVVLVDSWNCALTKGAALDPAAVRRFGHEAESSEATEMRKWDTNHLVIVSQRKWTNRIRPPAWHCLRSPHGTCRLMVFGFGAQDKVGFINATESKHAPRGKEQLAWSQFAPRGGKRTDIDARL